MTQRQKALLSCAVAAALLLSGCRKGSSNSGSMSSSNAMSGSSGSARRDCRWRGEIRRTIR